MYRVHYIDKEILESFLKEGKTTREIQEFLNIKSNSTVGFWIRKYGLQNLYNKPKYPPFLFNSIDTKEKAYCIGFLIADGSINDKNNVEISVGIKDKELLEVFSELFGNNYKETFVKIESSRRFPRARISRKVKDILKFTGGRLKKDRTIPIVRKDLIPFLLRGLFDADGCISWGNRNDRNKIWHHVSFASQYKILEGLQKILYNIGITTSIMPVKNSNYFKLSFSKKEDIKKFFDYMYSNDVDFMPLKRKYEHYKALRQLL